MSKTFCTFVVLTNQIQMTNYQINSHRNELDDVIYTSKNDQGQIISLTFECDEYRNLIYWNVVLWIGKRKRGYEFDQQTGRDGLKSLLWAKSCLIDFMNNLNHSGCRDHLEYKTNHICICWDNNRRKKTYIRGLTDLGFKMTRIGLNMWLHKII